MAELKKVFWDAGHGGSDPGAVKYVKESEVNIKVVNYAVEYMKKNFNCEVYKDITASSIRTVVSRANEWGADLFVSVHFNAGGGNGYEALVYSEKNKALGQCFEKHVKAVGQNSRGVKYRPDLGVLRLTDMKAILNEIAFVDNKKDIQDWDENAELKVMGEALAKAAAEWLDIPEKKKQGYIGTLPTLPAKGYFKKGDTGKQVEHLQKFLNWAIGTELKVDGSFGNMTLSAVETYQAKYDLVVDGYFGKKCLAKATTIKK